MSSPMHPLSWQCNHRAGQRFMGGFFNSHRYRLTSLKDTAFFQPSPTSASGPGWLPPPPQPHTTHTPPLSPNNPPRIHPPPLLACSDAPVMSCRSKGHAWAVTPDWSADKTALFGDSGEACLFPCQSFLTTGRLSNCALREDFGPVVTVLHLTVVTDRSLFDAIHLI